MSEGPSRDSAICLGVRYDMGNQTHIMSNRNSASGSLVISIRAKKKLRRDG